MDTELLHVYLLKLQPWCTWVRIFRQSFFRQSPVILEIIRQLISVSYFTAHPLCSLTERPLSSLPDIKDYVRLPQL
jgi:hypothetical protein